MSPYIYIVSVFYLLVSLNRNNPVTAEITGCDLNRRLESCPDGFCCTRDEFLPQYVFCKPIGQINSSCSLLPDTSVCNCDAGLICVPNVNSQQFVSIYGMCQLNITTTTTSTTTSTTTTPTTTQRATTVLTTKPIKKHHNHPPLITLGKSRIEVSKFSAVGQMIGTFSVKDTDIGAEGFVTCSFLQLRFFNINKIGNNTYGVFVATSLKELSVQSLTDFIMCNDHGSPPLNGIAQLTIDIESKPIVSTTRMPATKPSTSTHKRTHAITSLKRQTADVTSPEGKSEGITTPEESFTSKKEHGEITTDEPIRETTYPGNQHTSGITTPDKQTVELTTPENYSPAEKTKEMTTIVRKTEEMTTHEKQTNEENTFKTIEMITPRIQSKETSTFKEHVVAITSSEILTEDITPSEEQVKEITTVNQLFSKDTVSERSDQPISDETTFSQTGSTSEQGNTRMQTAQMLGQDGIISFETSTKEDI